MSSLRPASLLAPRAPDAAPLRGVPRGRAAAIRSAKSGAKRSTRRSKGCEERLRIGDLCLQAAIPQVGVWPDAFRLCLVDQLENAVDGVAFLWFWGALHLQPSIRRRRSSAEEEVTPPRPAPDLLLQLVQLRQQLVVRHQLFGALQDLLVADRPRLVDDHVRALRIAIETVFRIGLEEPVGFQRRARQVADQREGEAHLLAPLLVGRHEVGADAQDLGIAALELGEIELESRDLARSGRREGADEAEEHDVLLAQVVGERQLLRGRRRQRKRQRLVADFERRRRRVRRERQHDCHRDLRHCQTPHGASSRRRQTHRSTSGWMNSSASFPSHSRGPIARPTITPLRSSTSVTGSQRTPCSRATTIRGSKSVRILWPCFSRYGLTSFSPRPSSATKYTTRSFGNFAWRFSRLLSSLVQEEHQVAPKLRTAIFPASRFESTIWPERSGSENAGAGVFSRRMKTSESCATAPPANAPTTRTRAVRKGWRLMRRQDCPSAGCCQCSLWLLAGPGQDAPHTLRRYGAEAHLVLLSTVRPLTLTGVVFLGLRSL